VAITPRSNHYHLTDLPERTIALERLPKNARGKFDRNPLTRQRGLP